MTPSSPRCRGILKRYSSSESPKHVSFCADEECEVYEADVYDRTPCAVCTKLSYSDVLELKQLEISLRTAQRENSPYLSNVPLVLLPLLPSDDSSSAASSSNSSGTSSPVRTPPLSDSMNTPPPTPPRNRPSFQFLPLLPPTPAPADPEPPSPSPAPEPSENVPPFVRNVNPALMTPPQESVALDSLPAPTLAAVPSPSLVPPSPFSLAPPTPTTPTMRVSPLFGLIPTQRSSRDFIVAPISSPFLSSPTRPRGQSESPVLSS